MRRAMAELNAPAPQQIELYTRGAERLCAVFIPRDDTLTVEQSHTMLSTLTKRLTAALPPRPASLWPMPLLNKQTPPP